MSLKSVVLDEANIEVCLMGNEAFARGALEAGVNFVSSYPGSPSSEICGTLFKVAKDFGFYGEWSTNEKVGLEAAGAASLSGLRALSVMKHNGINVCLDFLIPFAQEGCEGGMVVIVCDDPDTHSSTNETDSRFLARMSEIPMLEPTNFQDAKDMTKYAFELSEELKMPVMVRGVTRLSHARGNVVLGELPKERRMAKFGDKKYITNKVHYKIKEKNIKAKEIFDNSNLNKTYGNKDASDLIIATGVGYPYAVESVKKFDLDESVCVLNLATVWPLPEKTLKFYLEKAERVLFIEEIESYAEDLVKSFYAQNLPKKSIKFHGKADGTVTNGVYPGLGELNPDIVFNAVNKSFLNKELEIKTTINTELPLPQRELTFCSGCPHRASYWALEKALKIDGRGGFALGDIGCYGLQALMSQQDFMKTLHCMGSGMGMANGFGNLRQFGMDKPVVPVVGDSTFFHSCLQGLVNGKYNGAKFTLLVLDNSATAMTGFQNHPGTGKNALGDIAPKISIEDVCRGVGVEVFLSDAYDIKSTINVIKEALKSDTVNVVVLRRACALMAFKGKKRKIVAVNQDKCLGEKCGLCSRKFKCPGNIWDKEKNKAKIDEVLCVGCGVCVELCPVGAIEIMEVEE